MASGGSDQDVKDALSKLLHMGTVAEYQNEFEILINRVTMGSLKKYLHRLYLLNFKLSYNEIEDLKAYNLKEKANLLTPIAEAMFEESVKNRFGPSKYEDLREGRGRYRSCCNWVRPVDEFVGKFAEFFKDKRCVKKVLSVTKIPEGGNSHSAYSPYHLKGKRKAEEEKDLKQALEGMNAEDVYIVEETNVDPCEK
ncbi:hypothetical protein Tco_0539465 [Tanacetum coccineum]